MWLSSKGGLSKKEQQFGPWLSAPQFNPARKAIIEVQGFESPGTNRNLQCRTEARTSSPNVNTLATANKVGVASADAAVVNMEDDTTKKVSMEVVSSSGV
nr:hypothetical protein CFP56_36809 [Quercus suber]